jgi:hypothetical protein
MSVRMANNPLSLNRLVPNTTLECCRYNTERGPLTASLAGSSELLTASLAGSSELLTASLARNSGLLTASLA